MGSDHPFALERFYSSEHGETLERIACPACGEEAARVRRVAHDRLFGRPGRYQVVECARCSMMYTNPRPTFDSLGAHYPQDYFCYDEPEKMTGLRKLFFGAATRSLIARRLHVLESITGRLAPNTRVCDVGCSYGQLLEAMKVERSCDVTGVDFNAAMVEACRRRSVPAVHGTLKDAAFEDARFDLVVMTEYLEHEGDPGAVLAECRRITRPGGHLVVEVPLISAWGARLFGNFWSQLDLPRHLMFFTPRTLDRMLRERGYEIVSVRFLHGSIGMSLLHLFGYERIGRMTTLDIIATCIASLLMLPLLPFLREFMFVVARAVEPGTAPEVAYPSLPAPPAVRPLGAPEPAPSV